MLGILPLWAEIALAAVAYMGVGTVVVTWVCVATPPADDEHSVVALMWVAWPVFLVFGIGAMIIGAISKLPLLPILLANWIRAKFCQEE